MGLFSWRKLKKEKKPFSAKAMKDEDKPAVAEAMADKLSSAKATESKKATEGKSMKELYGGSEVATTVKDGKKVKKERKYDHAYRVLLKPMVTEKAANLGTGNKYIFAVQQDANKIEIAKAVNELYGIAPTGVNVVKMKGKNVRHGRKTGKRKNWKKAIVTLPAGKSINIYEGV